MLACRKGNGLLSLHHAEYKRLSIVRVLGGLVGEASQNAPGYPKKGVLFTGVNCKQ